MDNYLPDDCISEVTKFMNLNELIKYALESSNLSQNPIERELITRLRALTPPRILITIDTEQPDKLVAVTMTTKTNTQIIEQLYQETVINNKLDTDAIDELKYDMKSLQNDTYKYDKVRLNFLQDHDNLKLLFTYGCTDYYIVDAMPEEFIRII